MLKDLGIGKNSDITVAKRELKIAFGQISELDRIVRDLDIY